MKAKSIPDFLKIMIFLNHSDYLIFSSYCFLLKYTKGILRIISEYEQIFKIMWKKVIFLSELNFTTHFDILHICCMLSVDIRNWDYNMESIIIMIPLLLSKSTQNWFRSVQWIKVLHKVKHGVNFKKSVILNVFKY